MVMKISERLKNVTVVIMTVMLTLCFTSYVESAVMSGGNFEIDADVLDSGGNSRTGGSYTLNDSPGQPGGINFISGSGNEIEGGYCSINIVPAFVPGAPSLTGVDPTTINVVISTNGNHSGIEYAIALTNDNWGTTNYVQADGTSGATAVWQNKTNWGGAPGKNVTGLVPGSTYKVKVKARTANWIETAYSSESSLFIGAAVPAAPQLSVLGISSITCIINTGTNPDTIQYGIKIVNLTASVTKYVLADKTLGDDSAVYQTTATWGNINITGLSENTRYELSVKAKAGLQITDYGASRSSYTALASPDSSVMSFVIHTTSLTVTVTPPVNSNKGQTGMEIDNTAGTNGSDSGPLQNTYVFQDDGINTSDVYVYRVRYYNGDGVPTAYSASVNTTLPPDAPQLTVLSPTSIRSVIDTGTRPGTVQYAVKVENLITSDIKYVQADKTTGASAVYRTTSTWGTIDITGLSANTRYGISVSAQADISPSNFGTVRSSYTHCVAPDVTAMSFTMNENSITITVSPPPNSTSGLTGCEIDNTAGTGGTDSSVLTGSYTFTDGGLTPQTVYKYRVRYYNGDGIETAYSMEANTANIPPAPQLTVLSANSIRCVIATNDAGIQYAVKAVNLIDSTVKYVQADKTLGDAAVYQNTATWGDIDITGLSENTRYAFSNSAKIDGNTTSYGTARSSYTFCNTAASSIMTFQIFQASFSITVTAPPNSTSGLTGCEIDNTEGAGGTDSGPLTGVYTYVDDGLSSSVAYKYRVRYYNGDGIPAAYSAEVTKYTDIVKPTVETVSIPALTTQADGSILGVPTNVTPAIGFSEAMTELSVETSSNVVLRAVRNNLGETINELISGTVVYESTTNKITFTPTNPLPKGYVYELVVTTNVKDLADLPLNEEKKQTFSTIMDKEVRNVYVAADNGTRADIPASAITENYYAGVSTNPASTPLVATKTYDFTVANNRLITNNGEYGRPLNAREFVVFNTSGTKIEANFSSAVTITLPYTDADNDKIVDGTSPAVRASTLKVYWLDETKNMWVRLPGSKVDTTAKTVSAPVKHFSVYAIAGVQDTEVSGVYAYPVPYRPNDGLAATGTNTAGITFTNLPTEGALKIYTLSGELVREIEFSDNTPTVSWDVKTEGGSEVASGVYIWRIKSGSNSKTDKLMVIK